MSEHHAELNWTRASADFTYRSYNRDHSITFKRGEPVRFSAAPAYLGDEDAIDPEEAFVASLASCHLLTFLALACQHGFVVDSYSDSAVGVLEKNQQGRLAITRVTLRPRIAFSGKQPDSDMMLKLHHESHEQCFIANSVKTEVQVESQEVAA